MGLISSLLRDTVGSNPIICKKGHAEAPGLEPLVMVIVLRETLGHRDTLRLTALSSVTQGSTEPDTRCLP